MRKATKGIFIFSIVFILLSISFASAFWEYYDPWAKYNDRADHNDGKYYDYYSDTWTVNHETTSEQNYPWGYEKTTESFTDEYSYESKNYLFGNYHGWQPAVSYTNRRYKEPYSQWHPEDKNDYYYKPVYDNYLGYYNWRW
jgi:hypothetical protein